MTRYLFRRVVRLVLVLFLVTSISFFLVNVLPGDAATDMAGQDATIEEVQAARERLGLDRPVLLRYFDWLANLFQGDLGRSLRTDVPVWESLATRLPVTVELMVISLGLAMLFAVPAGILGAWRPGSRLDKLISMLAYLVVSVPSFMKAILLILVFALVLDWLPATGYTPIHEGVWMNLRGFILPALSIALVQWAVLMRTLRAEMNGVLQEDYIALARAKGIPTRQILVRHALKPSSFSSVTLLGLMIAGMMDGALIVEQIFGLPGIGRLLVDAIYARDYIVIQGCVAVIACFYVLSVFLIDLLYAWLDPRVRLAA